MLDRFSRRTPRVERAFEVAALSHEGAVRKGTSIPYIVHPVAVAQLLEAHGYGEDLVVAGLLHDAVEDTRYEDIGLQARLAHAAGNARLPAPSGGVAFREAFVRFLGEEFGAPVLDLVLAVTERKNDGGIPLDWLERKREQLDRLVDASPGAAALKAADAVHNIESTLGDVKRLGLGVLDRFRGGPLIVWHYSAIADIAAQRMGEREPLAGRVRAAARELGEAVTALRPEHRVRPYPPPVVY